jgi:hypothetical protein
MVACYRVTFTFTFYYTNVTKYNLRIVLVYHHGS